MKSFQKSFPKKSSQLVVPVILCGGSGSRLWPLSRASYPKQYLSLFSENPKTMLQQTQERIMDLDNIDKPIVICNDEHRFIAAEQLRAINISPMSIILEPEQKNTAPAITIAALRAIEDGNDPILLILSADHYIKNETLFKQAVNKGKEFAQKGDIVTFGITPDKPAIGYGYIEAEEAFQKGVLEASLIKRFIEKPELETAKKFILDNRFTWNSGIFIFKASTILNEIKEHFPSIFKYCKEAYKKHNKDLYFQRLDEESFRNCTNISIDKAVMEKTKRGVVIPLEAGWSDIGSWESLWEVEKDSNGNVISGKVLSEKAKIHY